ncbi:MAG TPA: hypothetical protein VMB81_08655 [Candidatus Sulfotelmatobacter sp.]|nr:hypothetical protein [Candidatus Sulfotelmatobacter sp.]
MLPSVWLADPVWVWLAVPLWPEDPVCDVLLVVVLPWLVPDVAGALDELPLAASLLDWPDWPDVPDCEPDCELCSPAGVGARVLAGPASAPGDCWLELLGGGCGSESVRGGNAAGW